MLTLADGQVATSATEILSGGAAGAQRVTATFVNSSATPQTLIVTFKRNGGTARVLRRAVLAQYESLEIRGIPIDAGDSLLAQTTTASVVDYLVGGEGSGSVGPMVSAVYDANGMLKTSNSASTVLGTAQTITSSSATAVAVGPNGTTNPSFTVDASTSSAATGLKVKSAAAAAGLAVSVTSSGTDENLTIDAKGAGTITLGGTSTGTVSIGSSLTLSAKNIITDTSTGMKIGTGTTQKIGFFNATPVAQIAGNIDILAGLVTLGLRASSSNPALNMGTGALTCGAISGAALTVTSVAGTGDVACTGHLTMTDAKNIVVDSTTGTKIGTAASQKLGFFNATPVVQRTKAGDGGGVAWDADSLATVLKNLGFIDVDNS